MDLHKPLFATLYFITVLVYPIYCNIDMSIIDYWKPSNFATSTTFLSIALDTVVIAENFQNFTMKDPKLIKLTKYLSPGYLRIGGNAADRLIFSRQAVIADNTFDRNVFAKYDYEDIGMDMPNFTMTGDQWTELNIFSRKTGLKILFDLNCLLRYDNGSWNSQNAKELIAFSDEQEFNIDWQLGNEPDAFNHTFNYALNATQLAKDFSTLKTILKQYPRYKNSYIVGPDTTRPRPEHPKSAKYLKEFLEATQKNILNAITFHQYYLNGREAVLSDFLNVSTFNLLEEELQYARNIIGKTILNNLPVWLGETSSAYGGGAPGLSNTFVGSFLWLDKLGLAAKYGLKIVIRQSLFHGYYALIDEDYKPTPDWWLSVLYKKLVGPEVLHCNFTSPETVRLYCQCAATQDSFPPKITVFGINIKNSKAYVRIIGSNGTSDSYASKKAFAYILTAAKSSLTSRNVRLNGKLLNIKKNGDIPIFQKKIVDMSKYLVMPPYSLAFWIIPSPRATVCSHAVLSLK